MNVEDGVEVLQKLDADDPLVGGCHRYVVWVHQNFTLCVSILRIVKTHPGADWKGKELLANFDLQRLDLVEKLLVTFALVHVEIASSLFFAGEITVLLLEGSDNVVDVSWWDESVTEASVHGDLLGLDVNLLTVLEL